MYVPDSFAEHDPAVLHTLIREHPLGTLITLGSDGLNANHIPFIFTPDLGPHGALQAHVARNNVVWQDFLPETEVLVVFGGPSAYVSPNWYPTKAETHRHVPTYNYAVVHAYGRLTVHDDEKWLRAQLGRLTKVMEAAQPKPWKMADAPSEFIREMIGQVVGIEIAVTRMIGKWKVSQNRLPIDRAGAAAGLRATGEPEAVEIADLIPLMPS